MFSFLHHIVQKKQSDNVSQEVHTGARRAERVWHRALLGASIGVCIVLAVGVWVFFFVQKPYTLVATGGTAQKLPLDQTELDQNLATFVANANKLSDLRIHQPTPPRVGPAQKENISPVVSTSTATTTTSSSTSSGKVHNTPPQIVP